MPLSSARLGTPKSCAIKAYGFPSTQAPPSSMHSGKARLAHDTMTRLHGAACISCPCEAGRAVDSCCTLKCRRPLTGAGTLMAVLQGVDPLLFHPRQRPSPSLPPTPLPANHADGPRPRRRTVLGVDVASGTDGRTERVERPPRLHGRFVVFSGGKFELRKAQDIVVGVRRLPDFLVNSAWHQNENLSVEGTLS